VEMKLSGKCKRKRPSIPSKPIPHAQWINLWIHIPKWWHWRKLN
jgi:hypothetical protein